MTETIATFPLPDGSEIAVYRSADGFTVEDHEIPPRFRPIRADSERAACRIADAVANHYRYPGAVVTGASS